jgi:hypothetical protein
LIRTGNFSFCGYFAACTTAMTNQTHEAPESTPVADWIAGQIPNPLLRLRFLQTVMRLPQDQNPPRSYKSWFLVLFLVVALLFTTPASEPKVPAENEIPLPPVAAASLMPATVRVESVPEIWQVEATNAYESYSNGLRIDNRFSVANRPRSYLAFSAARPEDVRGERRSVPAGIVFHTTESLQAPFEPGQNSALKGIGESLLSYVKANRAYHFVIDRFGRVYRVVRESDAANHAGTSIWSDPDWLYLNLNESFLAVSFETQTLPGQAESAVNPAQVRSAAMLTDMLRKRYGIPARNCVTHAQVSVNASNVRIGYHLDWASSFPFEQVGLPDNYALPLPSIFQAGFQFDSSFEHRAGVRVYQEAQLAERVLGERAAAAHLQVPAYRRALQKRYRKELTAVRRDANQLDDEE